MHPGCSEKVFRSGARALDARDFAALRSGTRQSRCRLGDPPRRRWLHAGQTRAASRGRGQETTCRHSSCCKSLSFRGACVSPGFGLNLMERRRWFATLGHLPLRLIGFVGQVGGPHPQLLDHLWFPRGLGQSSALPRLFPKIMSISHALLQGISTLCFTNSALVLPVPCPIRSTSLHVCSHGRGQCLSCLIPTGCNCLWCY